MNNTNPVKNTTQNIAQSADNIVGKKLALASNSAAPIVGPILVDILWKHKAKLLVLVIIILFLSCFALQTISYQFSANAKSFYEQIPEDQRECIQVAETKYGIEAPLLAAFADVIANFDTNHKSEGVGFLEISQDTWNQYGIDVQGNKTIDSTVICNNYLTLANKLKSLAGDSIQKIDEYNAPKKEQIKQTYKLFKGLVMIPYGNPIGLDQSDLAIVTSGYNVSRTVDGIVNVHTGIDFVPSQKWFSENPGKGTTDAIDKAIVAGKVSEFKDSYGALCAYITNEQYRVLYCHCNSFIVENGTDVKYGDPVCVLGNTGFSTGAHVHVEVHKRSSHGTWERLDPTPFTIPTNQ